MDTSKPLRKKHKNRNKIEKKKTKKKLVFYLIQKNESTEIGADVINTLLYREKNWKYI